MYISHCVRFNPVNRKLVILCIKFGYDTQRERSGPSGSTPEKQASQSQPGSCFICCCYETMMSHSKNNITGQASVFAISIDEQKQRNAHEQ